MSKTFYKAIPPFDTIQNIRNILYNTGIFVSEWSLSQGDFFHSRISIGNEGLIHLGLGTNGKGISPEYALASAYAELLERLQNNHLIYDQSFATRRFLETLPKNSEFRKKLEQDGSVLEFEYFPDEKPVSLRDLLEDENSNCYQSFGRKNAEYLKKYIDLSKTILCVPYYNVIKNTTEYLPAKNNSLGANGMCAGNTGEEAMVHGLCEIFERFAVKEIFLKNVIPPSIPLEEFAGTSIYEKIQRLREKQHIEVTILDCSMNMGLPVIGAMIVDKNLQKYRLMMGSATDPEIALERCFTEHYQGGNPLNVMSDLNCRSEYPAYSDHEINYINLYAQLINMHGELDMPAWLYKKPSYNFIELTRIKGDCHKEELQELIKIMKMHHYQILVRDNSTLGFPCFHFYIPGMSELYNMLDEDDIYINMLNADSHEILFDLKKQSKENILTFCNLRDKRYNKVRPLFDTIKQYFLYQTNEDINEIIPFLFLSTLYFYAGDTKKAIKYLEKYIESEKKKDELTDFTYYYCAKQYMELGILNKDMTDVMNSLKKVYNLEIIEEVLADLQNPDNALQYYVLPTCFHCENCPVKPDCKYFEVMKIIHRIQTKTKKDIDQQKLEVFFI